MTGLPRAENGLIDPRKIEAYLLNRDHPVGGPKARFFLGFGLSTCTLTQALLRHARERHVTRTLSTAFGERFELHCTLVTPDGRNPCIVSVWQIDHGTYRPKLLTARPR